MRVEQCPDLRHAPWGLAAAGLCGHTRVLDIGGVPYLMPTVMREKVIVGLDSMHINQCCDLESHLLQLYNMRDYPALTASDPASRAGLVIGAGAGPWPHISRNAEMMPNLYVGADLSVRQETRITRTHDEDGSYSTHKLPASETRNALLGNLFISDGEPGEVLRIDCRGRTGDCNKHWHLHHTLKSSSINRPNVTHPPGDKNLVTCMRETLEAAYPELALGLGGVFSIRQGQAKFHVMPDFSPCPINTNEV